MKKIYDMRHTTDRRPPAVCRGFTLVELLVVIGIFTILTTLILARYSQFNNTILLSNLAYDMALSTREAQVYGLSVRERGGGTGRFDVGYGIYFSKATPTSYLLFADNNGNRHFDEAGDTVITVYTLRRAYEIVEFCVSGGSGASLCTPDGIAALSVSFKRPDPDAFLEATPDAGNPGANQPYGSAVVRIRSPQGERRSVTIVSTGQISVGY